MAERSDEEMVPAGAGVAILLAVSYAVAAGAAVAVTLALGRQPGWIVVGMLTAMGLGLLCTATLQRNIYLIDLARERLARGLPTEHLRPRPQWPLADAFASINILGRRMSDQARREHETSVYREQLLERVGSAAAQEERNRLARELHDSIKQQIFSISMSAAATEARWESDPAGARAAIADVQRSAQEALVEMQALLQELRPGAMENVGLREAVQTQCEALGYRTGASVTLERFELPPEDRFPPAAQEALFRILQEGLSNVARHARARTVTVGLGHQSDVISLWVRDDGRGFDPVHTSHGSGLAGMRERAQSLGGNLEVESVPGKGTLVRVQIPLRRVSRPESETNGLDRLREERRSTIRLGTLVEQITVTLIFLGAPISAVTLGLVVALLSYGRLRLLAAQMSVQPGVDRSEDVQQAYQEDGLLSGALGIAGLCVLYLFVAERGWQVQLQGWQIMGAALAIEALAALTAFRWYRGIERYLRRLPAAERQPAARQRLRSVRDSVGIWAVVVVIALIAGLALGFPPHTLNQWADGATLAVLVVWPVIDVVDFVLTRRWRNRLPVAAT